MPGERSTDTTAPIATHTLALAPRAASPIVRHAGGPGGPLATLLGQHLAPALRASRATVAAAAVGLAAEYAVRTVANRALSGLVGAAASAAPRAVRPTRTVVTELVILERGRRR